MSIQSYAFQARPNLVRFGETSRATASATAEVGGSAPVSSEPVAQATPPKAPEKLKLFRSLLKGFFDPIVSVGKFVFNNPVKAGIYLGATLVALQNPLIAAALSWTLFAYGGFQMASGTAQVLSGLKNKNNERANQGAEKIGHGVFDVAFTYNSAWKAVKNMRSTLQLLRETKGLTMLQKLNVFIRQVPKGASQADLDAVPKTLGETGKFIKDRFLGLFNTDSHIVPDNTSLKSTADIVVKNQAQVIELLQKNQDVWGVKKVLAAAQKLNVPADKVTDVPKLLAALYKDPELASALARVLDRKSVV